MLSIVVMNKRSILTAVLALGLGVTALTGCALWDATDLGDQHKGQAQEQARAIALEILEKM